MDNWVKRTKKGHFFMTGDEFPYPAVSRHQVEALIGEKLDEDIPIEEVIAAAAEIYHLFFLIPDAYRGKKTGDRWRKLLGDHAIPPVRATRYASVLDLGFGDSGKGLFVDALTRRWQAHSVARFSGGAQAGHNVVTPSASGAPARHHTATHWRPLPNSAGSSSAIWMPLGAECRCDGARATEPLHPHPHPTTALGRFGRFGPSKSPHPGAGGGHTELPRESVDLRCRFPRPSGGRDQPAGRIALVWQHGKRGGRVPLIASQACRVWVVAPSGAAAEEPEGSWFPHFELGAGHAGY